MIVNERFPAAMDRQTLAIHLPSQHNGTGFFGLVVLHYWCCPRCKSGGASYDMKAGLEPYLWSRPQGKRQHAVCNEVSKPADPGRGRAWGLSSGGPRPQQ